METHRRIDRWLRFEGDRTITVRSGRVEIGQGIRTALAQIVADELDVAIERIRMAPVATPNSPNEGVTAGSRSIEDGGAALRQVAAEARLVLLEAAARRLRVTADELSVRDGVIASRAGETITYWDLGTEDLLARDATGECEPRREYGGVAGHSVRRADIPPKVIGAPVYVQDLDLPAMLHGRVVRPPGYGAALLTFDAAEVQAMPGVVAVVRNGSFVGVIAEREEQAIRAMGRAAKVAIWDEHATLPPTTDARSLLDAPSRQIVLSGKPEEDASLRRSVRSYTAEYTRPYIAHASIGPSCAVARLDDGRYTIWSHTQGVYPLRRELARVLDVDEDDVVVLHVEGAGCYGHNCADDVALDAALLARAIPGRPVRVQLMREDEFAWEPYGPAMFARLSAQVDDKGVVVSWTHEVWSTGHSSRPSFTPTSEVANVLAARHLERPYAHLTMEEGAERNAVPLYEFLDERVVLHSVQQVPVRVSALRALGAHLNVFAIESFMDELAAASGTDPVEFRLRHLADARARKVIEAVARAADWRPTRIGDGARGKGIGFARYKNTAAYVAVVSEVEIDRDVVVRRAWAAVDAGRAVNPDGLVNQIEGGVIQAVSWTLKEQVRFDQERILTRNWADYPILTFPEVPAVDVAVVDGGGHPLGAGEAAQGPTSAAVANAIHAAMGLRLRDMPFTRARIIGALSTDTAR